MSFLEVSGLRKNFGGLRAVDEVSFGVREGMIKAVIGPNGAGKTTLFNLISGYLSPDAGSTVFRGRPIHGLKPYRIAESGVSRTTSATRRE